MDIQLPQYTPTLAVLIILGGLYLFLQPVKCDPREPPLIPTKLPYVGHILGMIRHGGRYFRLLSAVHQYPIFTLPTLSSRTYVVTSPALAAAVQRASKVLSFDPVVPEATKRVIGLDAATVEIVKNNVDRKEGNWGFIPELHDMVFTSLGPGKELDALSHSAVEELLTTIGGRGLWGRHKDGPLDLFEWSKYVYSIATAEFLYGPNNPFAVDPTLIDAFWDFDAGLGPLLLNVLPSVTARKPYLGRERLVDGFKKYLQQGSDKDACPIVKKRIEVARKWKFSLDGTARSELSFLFAGITNTAISSFWLTLRIFADKELLEAIRTELESHAVVQRDGTETPSLSLSSLKSNCPLLLSAYRETLRLASDNSSTRLVLADTVLADEYFLRKGSVLQIAGASIHSDPAIWGEDPKHFNSRRFLDPAGTAGGVSGGIKGVHPAAFRAFGGGATLCPGRHLATLEVLAFAAAVVMGFDVVGRRDGGEARALEVPEKKDWVLPVHVCEPVSKVVVEMRERRRVPGVVE